MSDYCTLNSALLDYANICDTTVYIVRSLESAPHNCKESSGNKKIFFLFSWFISSCKNTENSC